MMMRRLVGIGIAVSALGGTAFAGLSVRTPEIDAGSMLSGLTLLSGAVLILTNRGTAQVIAVDPSPRAKRQARRDGESPQSIPTVERGGR